MNKWIDVCSDPDVQDCAKRCDLVIKIITWMYYVLVVILGGCVARYVGGTKQYTYQLIALLIMWALFRMIKQDMLYRKGALCAKIWFDKHCHRMIERNFDENIEELNSIVNNTHSDTIVND